MKWEPVPDRRRLAVPDRRRLAVQSGRFTINRSPQEGMGLADGAITYMLVDGQEIVAVERGVANNDESKRAAVGRLKAMAEERSSGTHA